MMKKVLRKIKGLRKRSSQDQQPLSQGMSILSIDEQKNALELTDFRLIELPVDLLLRVLDFLDWGSIQSLRLGNKYLAAVAYSSNLRAHYLRCKTNTALFEEDLMRGVPHTHLPSCSSFLWYVDWMKMKGRRAQWTKLPCYTCLKWFKCKDVESSVFSYAMATSKVFDLVQRADIYRYSTKSRVCFDCGVKAGLYVKGSRFKGHIICKRCGQLGRPWPAATLNDTEDENGRRYWCGIALRYKYYCETCATLPSIPRSLTEYNHELDRNFRYQKTMWRKWEETKAIRRRLEVPVGDEGNKWEVWCPILRRTAKCDCWRRVKPTTIQAERYVW